MAIKLIVSTLIAVIGLTVLLLSSKPKEDSVPLSVPLFPAAEEARTKPVQKPFLPPEELPSDSMFEPMSRPSMIPSPQQPEQVQAPLAQGPLRQMFGNLFTVNDIVKSNMSSLNLRNEDCDKIGTVNEGALMEILNKTTRFCIFGDELFRMWYVKIKNSGQIGWVAGFFLEKILEEETTQQQTTNKTPAGTIRPFVPPTESPTPPQLSVRQAELWGQFRGIFPQTTPYPSQLSPNQAELWEMYQQMFAEETPEAPAGDAGSPLGEENTFGGLIVGRQECIKPAKNYAIYVLEKSGKVERFIWKMCESKLEEFLGILETVPCGLPEMGLYTLGELGEDIDCKGGGGSAEMIIRAGIGRRN